MTDLDALIAACQAQPDEDTPRLAYLDALEEETGGPTDFTTATREFYAKCKEPRRFKGVPSAIRAVEPRNGEVYLSAARRRALPGWREWLAPKEALWYLVYQRRDEGPPTPMNPGAFNWPRILPTLWKHLGQMDRWRRDGARVNVLAYEYEWVRHTVTGKPIMRNHVSSSGVTYRVRLTFDRGWLARAEFRDWQSADALLPAILTDQPFVEAGIRGTVTTDHNDVASYRRALIGPAFDLIDPQWDVPFDLESAAIDKRTPIERFRVSVSRAIITRARSLTPVSASHPAPS
jgi:uncharacterized protein (TIGR02996 family)